MKRTTQSSDQFINYYITTTRTHRFEIVELCDVFDYKLDMVYTVADVKQSWYFFGCLPTRRLCNVSTI